MYYYVSWKVVRPWPYQLHHGQRLWIRLSRLSILLLHKVSSSSVVNTSVPFVSVPISFPCKCLKIALQIFFKGIDWKKVDILKRMGLSFMPLLHLLYKLQLYKFAEPITNFLVVFGREMFQRAQIQWLFFIASCSPRFKSSQSPLSVLCRIIGTVRLLECIKFFNCNVIKWKSVIVVFHFLLF